MTMQANKQNSKTWSAYDIMTLDLTEAYYDLGKGFEYEMRYKNKKKVLTSKKYNLNTERNDRCVYDCDICVLKGRHCKRY